MTKIFKIIIYILFLSISILKAECIYDIDKFIVGAVFQNNFQIINGNNVYSKIYPASMTKMMTLYLVLSEIKSGKLSLDQQVIVSKNAYDQGKKEENAVTMLLKPNEKITIKKLIEGVIVASANDAAYVLVENVNQNPNSFISTMNKTAKKLGLTNTHFTNPVGFQDKNHYSTLRDMFTLSYRLMNDFKNDDFFQEIEKFFTVKSFQHNQEVFNTTNPLLFLEDENIEIKGIKTGHTVVSGYSLSFLVYHKKEKFNIMGVISGTDSKSDRFQSAVRLIRCIYDNYKVVNIYKKGELIGKIPISNTNKKYVQVLIPEDINIILPKNMNKKDLNIEMEMKNNLKVPLKKGAVVGDLKIYNNNLNYNMYYDLYNAEDVFN